jgi:hypothetical protein
VSALNLGGESINSLQAGAMPVSLLPPQVAVATLSGQFQLSWPADHTSWRLQVQTNSLNIGLGTDWLTVANSTKANQISIPMAITNGSVFYRLIYP